MAEQPDPFDSILTLEESYYHEGYNLGVTDGSRAGRIEGRVFGLEKGFDKFVELGRLSGRAAVWSARLPGADKSSNEAKVSMLSDSGRLGKQVERFKDYVDLETMPTLNDEESVNRVDDRLREAKTKATLIAKMVGEESGPARGASSSTGKKTAPSEMEDFVGLSGS